MNDAEMNSFISTATTYDSPFSDGRKRSLCRELNALGWSCKRIARAVNVTADWVQRSI